MVVGVKTKSRTNPYPQKKPDPAWILWRLWHHHLQKIISQDPGYSFLRIALLHKWYTTCIEISNNCKWELGRESGGQTL